MQINLRRYAGLFLIVVFIASCSDAQPQTPEDFEGRVGTLVAATLTALPTNTSEPPSDSALATAVAATSAALPTFTPTSSVTPTEMPTETPIPLPTLTPTLVPGDPRAELGDPAWRATFQDNSPNWFLFEDDQTRISVQDRKLILSALKANNFDAWSLSWPVLTDFYLEITGVNGECANRDRYGLIFRSPDPAMGYLFGISCDGAFRLRKWDGKQFTQLTNWTQSDHIRAGSDQTNRLGVLAEGDRIGVYVNGHFLVEIQDDSYESGRFGAFIAADKTPEFSVEITEAAYWDLP